MAAGNKRSLLVVGSVAFDSIETPNGSVADALGGSATYFSYAASFFLPPRLVAPVGEDFPDEHRQLLIGRGVDASGLVTLPASGIYTLAARSSGGQTGSYAFTLQPVSVTGQML